MEQIENNDSSRTEGEKTGFDMTSVQERVGAVAPGVIVRVEAAIKEHPEFAILRAKLLEHGGKEIVPPFDWDDDQGHFVTVKDSNLPALIDLGCLMTGPVVCRSKGMEPCRSHQNIARLWLQKRKRDALIGIGTGYCLSDDLWRQHSWGIRKHSLLETLGEREKYFGIRLEGVDADVFAFKALCIEKKHWPLFSREFLRGVQAELAKQVATGGDEMRRSGGSKDCV